MLKSFLLSKLMLSKQSEFARIVAGEFAECTIQRWIQSLRFTSQFPATRASQSVANSPQPGGCKFPSGRYCREFSAGCYSRLPLKKEVLLLFSFQIGIISILEYIGVISFAVIGAFTAMQKKMDLFGVSVLAFTAACGGGILRDVIMDVGVPVFFSSYTTIALVMLSVLFVFLMPRLFYFSWVLVVLDAIGLSFFAVDAGIKAINQNYTFVQFVFVAVITAVGGGILRDILAQRVPVIFRRDIYALAALAGVICMWFIYPIIGERAAMKLGLALIFLIRIISVYYNINLPVLKAGGDSGK